MGSAFLPVPTTSGPSGGAAAAAASAAATSATTPTVKPPTNTGSRICESCGTVHDGNYGSGRFCGVGCARRQGARRKWSVTPKARRAKRERAPCEACHRMHDASFGSGRFCSVNCARRMAASQKWSKSRAERSRRLDAIRPSATSVPSSASPSPSSSPSAPAPQLMFPLHPMYPYPYGAQVMYGPDGTPHQHTAPVSIPMPQRTPVPIVYAPALAVPWAPAHAHPLAHAPVQIFAHVPRPATALQQLAKTPVTPPSPPRSRSSSPNRYPQECRTDEGDASEALLVLGAGRHTSSN